MLKIVSPPIPVPRLPVLRYLSRWRSSFSLRALLLAIFALQMLGVAGLLIFLEHHPGNLWVGLLSFAAIAISLLGGLVVVDLILAPLEALKTAAQTMARGNWQTPLRTHRFGELRDVAIAFNEMAAQLQESFSQLEYLNQALTQSERRWREFLDVMPMGVVVCDHRGRMVFASAEARQLLRLEDMPSVPDLAVVETLAAYCAHTNQPYPPDRLPLMQSLQGNPGWADNILLRHGDQMIPIEMASTPIFDREGRVEYAIAAFQDITTRRQAQQVLADYNQTLERTVAQRTADLHQAQTTQRLLFEAIPDLLMRFDRNGVCRDVMSMGSVVMIAPPNEQIGRSIAEVLPADMVAERMHYIRLALDTGQNQVYEYRFLTPKGWRHEEARVVVSGADEVMVMVRDITERKQAELSLQESQLLYRSLAEILPHALYRIDRQGRLTFANPAYLKLLDTTLEACLGQTAFDLFPAELAARYVADDEQVMTTGEILDQINTYPLANGQGLGYVQICKSPVYDAEGNITGMQGVFWDITDLKQTETALASQKQFLQNVIDSVPSTIVVKDRDHRIQIANQASAALHGITPADMLGQRDIDINPNISLAEAERNCEINRRVIETQEPYQAEQEITDMAGVSRWYQLLISPFRDTDGNINGVVSNCLDITDRKQIETALQAANEKLERLATLDGLTQIPNRRRFDEYLEQEWQRLVREQQPLSLILFDVDFFKPYNDHFGHQQGDEGLIAVARAATQAVKRAADLLARYGGEEFGVILPNTRRAGAESVAKDIQSAIAELQLPHPLSTVNDYLTVSLGIASVVPSAAQSPEDLIAAADAALYQAKRRGRNRYWIRLI